MHNRQGHRRSQCEIKFANLHLSKASMDTGDANEVSVDVTNIGSVPGDAVAQIYIHQRYGSTSRPVRQLKGFKRIALQPGEAKTLKFPLGSEELNYWNPQTKEWVVEPSEFDVWAGDNSDAGLHAEFTLTH
jgi:beta-glucosidase